MCQQAGVTLSVLIAIFVGCGCGGVGNVQTSSPSDPPPSQPSTQSLQPQTRHGQNSRFKFTTVDYPGALATQAAGNQCTKFDCRSL